MSAFQPNYSHSFNVVYLFNNLTDYREKRNYALFFDYYIDSKMHSFYTSITSSLWELNSPAAMGNVRGLVIL